MYSNNAKWIDVPNINIPPYNVAEEEWRCKGGTAQGSALRHCLFPMVMDRMTNDIREEAPWIMMFANDIVICSESKEQKSWRAGDMLWREEELSQLGER